MIEARPGEPSVSGRASAPRNSRSELSAEHRVTMATAWMSFCSETVHGFSYTPGGKRTASADNGCPWWKVSVGDR